MLKSQQIVADRATELKLQGKAQKEIAYIAGFQNANVIAMIKSGSTKIALERAPDLEKALELPKGALGRQLLLEELGSDLYDYVRDVLDAGLSYQEREIIKAVREVKSAPKFDDRAKRVLIELLK